MFRIRPIEIFLIQCAIYLGLWFYDEYTGLLCSVIFAGIFLAILIISVIVEKIEPSKVPKSYFYAMFVSVLAPILVSIFYMAIMGGDVMQIFEF